MEGTVHTVFGGNATEDTRSDQEREIYDKVSEALLSSDLAMLIAIQCKFGKIPYESDYIVIAVRIGKTAVLEWISDDSGWKFEITESMVKHAAMSGDVDCLDWLKKNGSGMICTSESLILTVMSYCRPDIIEWFHKNIEFTRGHEMFYDAVKSGVITTRR